VRTTIAVLAALVLLTACSAPRATAPAPGEEPEFDRATILIDTDSESVLMYADVAENEEQHAYGLRNRTSLPEDEGMVFLFFQPRSGGFVMKDVSIPLSAAFFDTDGRILEIIDMDPCPRGSDPCPVHDPGVSYSGALQVSRGAFERAGVEAGDVIEIVPGAE
jgi:uncharacterized protein